jgi:hypothetical protein
MEVSGDLHAPADIPLREGLYGHWCIGEKISAHKILVESYRRDRLGNLCQDGRVILKLIFYE